MLASKQRILWIKWHAYLSCFFLPLALVYVLTGALYLLDIKGEVILEYETQVQYDGAWPQTQDQAKDLLKHIQRPSITHLPATYYSMKGRHGWYDFHREVSLIEGDDAGVARLTIERFSFWRQLLLIHTGHAGELFWLLGIALGLSLLFSLISGVVVALAMPKLKTNSLRSLLVGLALVLAAIISL